MVDTAVVSGTRRIAFATRDARAFVSLRHALLAEATRRRHTVVCLAPNIEPLVAAALQNIGVQVCEVAFEPRGFNPFAGYRVRNDLSAVMTAFGPHTLAVLDLDLLPAMAPIAERAAIRHVVLMTAALPTVLDRAQKKALQAATTVIVETSDAARHLASVLRPGIPVIVSPASGIDLNLAGTVALPPIGAGLTFVHVTTPSDRRARDVFAAAVEVVRPRSALARFAEADIDDLAAIAASHVVVHTGEQAGLAPGILAGLAVGRPIIVADVAGGRDVVDERVNGCRFPPGDSNALADAMMSFLRRPDDISTMARASRAKAERRFDVDLVNRTTLQALGLGENFAAAA